MSMTEWAKKEVELANKKARIFNNTKEGEWDPDEACYKSALKAFESLMEDGHSGFSIECTKHILNRLLKGLPLTPIEDTDDIWSDISDIGGLLLKDEVAEYQCLRMPRLFKTVKSNGTVRYNDVDRVVCREKDSKSTFHYGFVDEIIDDILPITMPYMPYDKPIVVNIEDFNFDDDNGDEEFGGFDTIGIFDAVYPNGEKLSINRFFKASNTECGLIEIDVYEYTERKNIAYQNEYEKIMEEK